MFTVRTLVSWAVGLMLFVPPAWAQLVQPDSATLKHLRAYVASESQTWQIPGLSVAVASRGRILFQMHIGHANLELDVPITAASVFEIGSISKQFVATVTLQLRDEGLLTLDDSIHEHLPELPSEWRGVTVRHLLTHTSGIPDYEAIMGYYAYRERMTPERVIALAHTQPVTSKPGHGYAYSNTGYFLLGLMVERLDGRSLGDILASRIFEPAGMRHSRVVSADVIVPGRVSGYGRNIVGTLYNRDASQVSATLGAGAILSTVEDLVRWDAVLYEDAILPEHARAEAWRPYRLADGTETNYGFGWRVEPYEGHAQQYHYGMTSGFVANMTRLPEDGVTVIVLGNRYQARINRIVVALLHAFVPSLGPSGLQGAPH